MSQALLIPGIGRLNLQRLLFGAGEVGGIWDWSDRSTMFQDNFGTTPITASGQTRGLHLDKSRGLVLGTELVVNGGFSTTDNWTLAAGSGGSAVISGGLLTLSGPNTSFPNATQSGILTANRWYRVTVNTTSNITAGSLGIRIGGVATQYTGFSTAGTYNLTIFSDGPDFRFIRNSGFTDTVSIDSVSVRELPGNHRFQPNLSNRPQYIEDETGHYGLYGGVDDWDETNAVDFTGTDKVTVWWGGRKLSDAAFGILLELTTNGQSINGGLVCSYPSATTVPDYFFGTRGTSFAGVDTPNNFAAPVSNVICNTSDIAAPFVRIRVNGQQVAESTVTQGTGNFANAKLYFGRRAGTSLAANIREYMTIIRGAQTPTNIIERVEREVRRKIKGLIW